MEKSPETVDREKFLALVDQIGKGRFAQRLATQIDALDPPAYIADAINFVADRV
jgi:putative ATP-dependent endonuclease of OLD family